MDRFANLSGTKKAAVLLLALGTDDTVEVTRHLDPAMAYDVIREVAKMEMVPEQVTTSVLTEFLSRVPKGGTGEHPKRFAQEVLKRSFGQEKASSLDFLRRVDRGQLVDIVNSEHPQVVAYILSVLKPDQASELLAILPPEQQVEIARRIATTESPTPEVLGHLTRTLSSRLNLSTTEKDEEQTGGLESLVGIMKNANRTVEQNILTRLEDADPSLAEELRKRMVVFEDLATMDDRSVQRVIQEVDRKVLALALKQCPDPVKDKVLHNLPERARNILMEDIQAAGRVRVAEVEKAQSEIAAAVRRLESEGEIVVSRDSEQYVS